MPNVKEQSLVTINGFARELGMDHKRVTRIMDGVEPMERHGTQKFFRWRQFVDAYVKDLRRDEDIYDLNLERARLAHAQAAEKEIQVQLLEGEIVKTSDVVSDVGEMVTNAKARLLGIPSKAAAIGEGMTRAELEDTLMNMVQEALNELAATSFNPVESAAEATG